MTDDVLGDASQQEMLQPRVAVRPHDNEVAGKLLGHPADNFPRRSGMQHADCPGIARRNGERIELPSDRRVGRILKVGILVARGNVERVQKNEFGSGGGDQTLCIIESVRRNG